MLHQFGNRTLTFNTPTLSDLDRRQLKLLRESLRKTEGVQQVTPDNKTGIITIKCAQGIDVTNLITVMGRHGVYAELQGKIVNKITPPTRRGLVI